VRLRNKLLLGIGAILLLQVIVSGGYTLATFYRLSAASSAQSLFEEWRRARFWLEQLKHELYSDVNYIRAQALDPATTRDSIPRIVGSYFGRSRADRIVVMDGERDVLFEAGNGAGPARGLERALLDPSRFRFPRNQFTVSTYTAGAPSLYLVTGAPISPPGTPPLHVYLIVDIDKDLVDRLRSEQGISVAFFSGDRFVVADTARFACQPSASGVQTLRVGEVPYRGLARVLSADGAEPLSMVVVRSVLAETEYLRGVASSFLAAFVLTLLVSVVLAAFITGYFVGPFVRLNGWLRRYLDTGAADWTAGRSRDEVDVLADTVHSMVRRLIDEERIIRDQWDRLVIAEKMSSLALLSAGLAHEMNNPLASILSHVGWLRAVESDEGKQDSLGWIEREATRMAGILDRIRAYARGSGQDAAGGGASPGAGPCDLNRAVRETLDVLRPELFRKEIELGVRIAEGLPWARIGEDELKQVALNLLVNAEQAVERGGRVDVETASRDGALVLTIRDDGCGIPQENLKRVFDPFFTTRAGGTGLGLSLAYRIVRHAGGDLRLASAPGRGTTVEVVLNADDGADRR
jgi:signal transduction histidine kinase